MTAPLSANVRAESSDTEGSEPPVVLRRLLPPGSDQTLEELIDGLELSGAADHAGTASRPYVALNMIATADGRAAIGGRTAALGNRADRELFHGLRGVVDAVMAGAGTVRDERYGRMVRDPAGRERRSRRGLAAEPLACVVSGRLALSPDLPLLDTPEARVAIVTASAAERVDGARAEVAYVRCGRDGRVNLAEAMAELRSRFSVRTLLCEGGPHLNAGLLQAGLVDELFLSVAPKLVSGTDALTIVAGLEVSPPVELELLSVLEAESYLFLRYRVSATR